ncbi:MAG: GNAT family N-acetyltransferase [Candidatus Electrothrix aestuarii]|uniref:GNAT family N-acetyltransferase n=1 Tax=Candidatus Electrothrix aestuarii TaxID=3062594 RepID=A0AAU8LT30_9BACT|nr:GNAT family N-acetyltransferase [Candidatus Electrothrix aestuarii]
MGRITAPEPLTSCHDTVRFDCGVPSINDWLRNQGLRNEISGASRTYVVCQSAIAVGFYSFSTGSVTCCGKKVDRENHAAVPVIVLSRLAVDVRWQGRGIGVGLLKDVVARSLYVASKIDVRALLVHSLNDQVKNFYARYGFTELTINPMVLNLPVADDGEKLLNQDHLGKTL